MENPLLFVEDMWGLTPQPLKPEYRERVKYASLDEITADWFEEFEKGKHLTWQQYKLFLALKRAVDGLAPRRIAIESGQGTGKTAALSMIMLWFLMCHKQAQVPVTAPTREQMQDALWKEVNLWIERMKEPFGELFDWSSTHVKVKEAPETWFARARTARKENPEALAGIHGDHVLVLVDEASGVHQEVFRVGEGVLTGEHVFVIMISQHTRLVGYFHDAFTKEQDQYQLLSFDSRESPVVDKQFTERIRRKYGEDSFEWRVQVVGKAPNEEAVDDKGFMPLFLESDVRERGEMEFVGPKRLGVDPAGKGSNETVWVMRDDYKAKILLKEKQSTLASICEKTLLLMNEHQIYPQHTFVDNFGVGANVALELSKANIVLENQEQRVYVNGVNVGDSCPDSMDAEKYMNMRACLAWRIKEWIRKGGEFIKDDDWDQLMIIRYKAALSGKMQLMTKEQMVKEGWSSPDCYDALALTFWFNEVKTKPSNMTWRKQIEKRKRMSSAAQSSGHLRKKRLVKYV